MKRFFGIGLVLLLLVIGGVSGEGATLYHLGLHVEGEGRIDLDGDGYSYPAGTLLELQAIPAPYFLFVCWEGDVEDVYASSTTVFLDEDKTVRAVFVRNERVEFLDPNLEQVVRESIEKMEGDLYVEDLLPVLQIEAMEREITSLEGIAYLYRLEALNVSRNEIRDLGPIAYLPRLKTLSFAWNQVSDLSPLAHLSSLIGLNFGDNQVSELLPLAELTALTILAFPKNQVEEIYALEKLLNLSMLMMQENSIASLAVLESMQKLSWLDFDGNRVSDLGPLVANKGLGATNTVFMRRNLLDLDPGSAALKDMETLKDRGVRVYYQ